MNQNNELLACYKVLSVLETASDNTESMLDNIPGVVVVLNQTLQVIRANAEFCKLCGRSLDQILGFDFTTLFSAENLGSLNRQLANLKTMGRPLKRVDFELEILPPACQQEARQFYWQATLVALPRSAEGDLISITGKDLSELYQSEMKLKNIFANLPLGMLIFGPNGKVHDVLAQFSEVLFERDSLIGLHLESLLRDAENAHEENFVEGIANFNSCFGQTKTYYESIEKSLPRLVAINPSEGTVVKWLSINYQPIMKLNCIDGFILLVEDASDSVQAQREMERISALERQIQAVYETAIRDPLTGLYTRLFMKDGMKSLISSFERGATEELAVLMMDVDHFKTVNDTYGHKVGDTVLAEVGRIILEKVRGTDIAIRYGGEEFLIVLPSNASDMTSGNLVANRIRADLESLRVPLDSGQTIRVTISGGAAWCQRGENVSSAIERADGYLYQAKRGGRNRIVTEGDK